MPAQFDATARINVDLGGFRQAASQATRSGGEMERVFRNLHTILGQVEVVDRSLAAQLSQTFRVYNQLSQAARGFASAVQVLSRNEAASAQGVRLMSTAFEQLRNVLSRVQPIGEREFQRIQRTLTLYTQMVTVINTLARTQQAAASVTQRNQQLEQAATRERTRAAEAARRLAIEEQRLQVARQSAGTAAQNSATQQLRAQTQLLRVQQQLADAQRRQASAQQQQTAAQRRATLGFDAQAESAFSLRSALGDLQGLYQGTINLLGQIGTTALGAAISHEAAFLQIERVTQLTGSELESMRHQFELLASELPTSFEETALVAQLAAQTGVANEQLIAFTDTVIQFSVTTGVASEQATLLFARIMEMRNIPAGDLENFASTILDLGVTSAATEDEILRLSESIATVTDIFGLSVPATLGLASAFANLRVRPELARGALTRVFAQLNTALTEGGTAAETLSSVLGGTQAELTDLLANDPDTFFLRFVQGMSTTVDQGGLLRQVLADLGVNAVRDIDVISRLANNYDLLAAQVSRARVEFLLGNTLQEQSQTIFETTRVEIDNLREAFTNLLARAAGPVATALGEIANAMRGVLEFASALGPIVPVIGALVAALGIAATGFIAYRIAVALAFRGVLAYSQAQSQLGGASFTLTGALQGLIAAQNRAAASATATAAATTQAAAAQAAAARGVGTFNTVAIAQAGFISAAVGGIRNLGLTTTQLQQNFATSTAAIAAHNRALMATAGITATAATSTANLNRASGLYAATTVRMFNVQQGLNAAYRASAASSAAAATSASANAAATTATAAASGVAAAATRALATSLAFLRANWVSLLGVAGLLLFAVSGMVTAFGDQADAMAEVSRQAVSAVGGISAYQEALIADTQAARDTIGGIEGVTQALEGSGAAATEAGRVYQTVAVAADELSGSLRERTARELDMIRTQQRAIELAWGNADALRDQAEGQGALAEAAQEALANLTALTDQEEAYESALNGTTLAFGERAAALVQQQFQEALAESTLLDTTEAYERLQAALAASDFNIGDIVAGDSGQSLQRIREIIEALEEFQSVASSDNSGARLETSGLADEFERLGLSVEQITELGGPTQLLDSFRFLQSVIEDNRDAFDSAQRSAAILTELGLDPLGEAAQDDAEAAEAAADALEVYQNRLDELAEAYRSVIDPAQAWRGENEEAIQSIDAFTDRLRAQVQAQQDFASNLAVLAAQGYGALVTQLQAMGPDGAAAAAELVDGTAAELRELELIATQAGDDYVNALAGSMDRLGQLDLGGEAAASISQGLIAELNRVSTSGGDLQLATERIISVLDLLDQQQITPEVSLEIIGALGNLEQLEAAIATARESGDLNAEGQASLSTLLFNETLSQLQADIAEAEANHEVDANGVAQLDPEGYENELDRIQGSAAITTLNNLLDVEGDAALSATQYEAALELLDNLVDATNSANSLDVRGNAYLLDSFYRNPLDELFRLSASANNGDRLDVQGTAFLNSDNFRNRQLPSVIQAAWNAGAEISRALTRTATVSVYYQNANNPPPRAIQAATGGWIHGPGGPTGDKIPAQLSDREFVVNARSARKYASLVEAINSDRGVDKAMAALRSTASPYTGSRSSLASVSPVSAVRQAGALNRMETGPTFNIYNSYPQAEPTSVTINRSLAYAASISGV